MPRAILIGSAIQPMRHRALWSPRGSLHRMVNGRRGALQIATLRLLLLTSELIRNIQQGRGGERLVPIFTRPIR